MATLVGDLDLPFLSLTSGAPKPQRTGGDLSHWLSRTELGYAIGGYDDVLAVLRDQRWHSGVQQMAPPRDAEFEQWRAERQNGMLVVEGADHDRVRHVLSPALTPQAVARLHPFIHHTVATLLDPLITAGSCEFVASVCQPFPVAVLFELLGAPAGSSEQFLDVVAQYKLIDPRATSAAIIESTERLDSFSLELLDLDRASPGGGVLSRICTAEADGLLTADEAMLMVDTLLIAGTESTQSQLGSTVALLARFEDQYQLLRDQPGLTHQAVEEALRYQGAARGTARVASEAIEHRDVIFPEGTLVLVGLTAANRDATVADNPTRFDVSRAADRPHLSFGHGVHFCVGAALARAELSIALTVLLDRVEHLTLDGEIAWLPPHLDFWGPASLPIAFG